MKLTNLFDSPLHNCLSEQGKKEVDKEHTEWLKEMATFLAIGLILGVIIGMYL